MNENNEYVDLVRTPRDLSGVKRSSAMKMRLASGFFTWSTIEVAQDYDLRHSTIQNYVFAARREYA
mgnify:CR=1 FL=1